jgi:pimeloyl-ACP methyl ester carboxylesterase
MAAGVGQDPGRYAPRRTPTLSERRGRAGTIAITRWGPPEPEPIVLLHGWMDCGAAFQLLVDCLPDDWPLLAIDWPGYGRSARHEGCYWFPEHLAELDWVLDEFVPGSRARLVGHSMGGTVASMYAGMRPARLAWLVNMEGFGMPALPPGELRVLVAGWLDSLRTVPGARRYADLGDLAAALVRVNPRLPATHARFLAEAWTRPVAGGFEILADPRQQLRTPIRYARADVEACWAAVTAPQLLLHGAESTHARNVLGEGGLERLRRLAPSLEIESIADSAHMLPHEQPRLVADAIVRFVNALA